MQWLVQYGSVTFFFLWHIFLNAYDLMGDPTSGTLIFVTALLGLTIFIQMPSLFGALYLALGYALFMALSGPVLDTGTKVNLTIASIVALGIIFTRSHHMVIELTQRREIKQINMQLRVLLQKDPLTGLLNKKACQEKAEACLGMASEIEPIAFFLIDLDNFKAINDTFGHPFGDYVLEQAARKLEAVFPDADGIGRIGGDEFVVITHATDAEALYDRAQQLIRAVSTLNSKKKGMDVCCSMGILRVSRSDLQYEQLYEETDQLLYEAKREGKGRCCLKEFSCL